MINLNDKDIDWYKSSGNIEKIDAMIQDYWDNSRRMESETIVDLEKHLWVVNSTAATLLLGYLQTKDMITNWQAFSATAFILGIVFLFFLKFVSAYNSSRDRYQFQEASSKFQAGEVTDFIFKSVPDKQFLIVKGMYKWLQIGSGVLFVTGLVLLLVGVWPQP
jgi:hypothetical protein